MLDLSVKSEPLESQDVRGTFVEFEGETYYRIANCQAMPEFIMNLSSSSDHWMFVSSRGAVTAGRRDPDQALFPYYSADKLIDMAGSTGPKTIVRIGNASADNFEIWEPFSSRHSATNRIRRNLYKNSLGNKLIFEEINDALSMVFRYRWTFGHRFGFIRDCDLVNIGTASARVSLLDGLQNIVPAGIDHRFQLRFSNLGDAYKKNELLNETGLGLFYLSSMPTDRAEPSEGLRATVAWHFGFSHATRTPRIFLSSAQLDDFRAGIPTVSETDVRGQRGSYLIHHDMTIEPKQNVQWTLVANVNHDQTDVIDLNQRLRDSVDIEGEVREDILKCQQDLSRVVSSADGRQMGNCRLYGGRHLSNVLFNAMRGGIPADGYQIDIADFRKHVCHFNKSAFSRNSEFLTSLGDSLGYDSLVGLLTDRNDIDLLRIGMEYLPLTFGRRHGDPTRPWNLFSIKVRAPDGSKQLDYQGNWRDVFQNWEALGTAYPKIVSSMVFRFVNASTADGYNPYKVMKSGFEWEKPDPDDRWANIGYWGDHQIIYLLRLLELSRSHNPAQLDRYLDMPVCTYANVPYRIRGYDDILRNPRETIDYDQELADRIEDRVAKWGADGKLKCDESGRVCYATLGEKLLVPALAKMTNFVPAGGIWLNTQRPEWNDANNALVGNGLSMVTVYHLRRFFGFMSDWFSATSVDEFSVSNAVQELFDRLCAVLHENRFETADALTDAGRKRMVDELQYAGTRFRNRVYSNDHSQGGARLTTDQCLKFFKLCLHHIDQAIQVNRRDDGLYHSYNLISFESTDDCQDEIRIAHLYEMLEGQVAVLSSGFLAPAEAVELLDSLRRSKMYRPDQESYMLYPDRALPRFLEKNVISRKDARSGIIRRLLDSDKSSILKIDVDGGIHFNGDFHNGTDLRVALDALVQNDEFRDIGGSAVDEVVKLFEGIFDHERFTGRSGTFFGYEGLGCIYWHMVSKLRLVVAETYAAAEAGADPMILESLQKHYRQICKGIGISKSPDQYGAFPIDPYSHTPKHCGAQQPGMTGQVKEDILARLLEIGVRTTDGIVNFRPGLFDSRELLTDPAVFEYDNLQGNLESVALNAGEFAFTLCQVPVVYCQSEREGICVTRQGSDTKREVTSLTRDETLHLFSRDGLIEKIVVRFVV